MLLWRKDLLPLLAGHIYIFILVKIGEKIWEHNYLHKLFIDTLGKKLTVGQSPENKPNCSAFKSVIFVSISMPAMPAAHCVLLL